MKKRYGISVLAIVLAFAFVILTLGVVHSLNSMVIPEAYRITTLEEARSSVGSMYREGGEKSFIEYRELLTEQERAMTVEQINSEMNNLESQGNTLEREAHQKISEYNVIVEARLDRTTQYENEPCHELPATPEESKDWYGCDQSVYNSWQNDLETLAEEREIPWNRFNEIYKEIRDIRWKIIYYEVWLVGMEEELETVTDGAAETYEVDDEVDEEEEEMVEAEEGDGKCELLKEFCFNSVDCVCHKGTRCIDNLPTHMDSSTAKQDWIGCVSLNAEMAEIKAQYKENIDKISKLGEDRRILNQLFRRNLARKIIKWVAIESPTPTGILDVISVVTLSIIQEYFYSEEMTDEEILDAQIKSIQKMNTEMVRLYDENQEIKQKFNDLKE